MLDTSRMRAGERKVADSQRLQRRLGEVSRPSAHPRLPQPEPSAKRVLIRTTDCAWHGGKSRLTEFIREWRQGEG